MKTLSLEVQKITTGQAQDVRNAGRVPAVVYGKEFENLHVSCDLQDFIRVFRKTGRSMIIELKLDGQEIDTLVSDLQFEPVSDEIIHIDFQVIRRGEELTTELPIHLVGESDAVRNMGGILMHNKETVAIKCLPRDLMANVEVDISVIKDFHTAITIADLKLPESITVLDPEDVVLVTVAAPRISAEEEETGEEDAATEETTEENKESE